MSVLFAKRIVYIVLISFFVYFIQCDLFSSCNLSLGCFNSVNEDLIKF